MTKQSNRERILTAGLEVVHARGYAGASVRDIVHAAGVPQGTFTNHFTSKEAFGLEIIDLYLARGRELMAQTLRNPALSPLARLRAYVDALVARQAEDRVCNGCLFGNFTAEASDHSDVIRGRLVAIFVELQDSIADCLHDAVQEGELSPDFACADVAGFIVASLQGANLLSKAERSPAPIERFSRVLFTQLLR